MANQNQKQGQGQGKMSRQEAGRMGGETTKEKYGEGFYSDIGQKGGEARADDPDVKSGELGRKGAEARWNKDQQEE